MNRSIRARSLLALCAFLCLAVTLGVTAPPAEAAIRDSVNVSGYDYLSERTSDVIAGSAGNNLVFRYVSTGSLADGTLIIDLPASDWPQPLTATYALSGDPSESGGVVVRPRASAAGPADCRLGGDPNRGAATTINSPTVHRIVVEHLNCQPGQQIAVRIFGLDSPATVGSYPFAVSVSDAAGAHWIPIPKLRVVRPPKIKLELTAPTTFQAGVPATVQIRALKPNGRVDTGYRGGVAFLTRDQHDCTFEDQENHVYDFTAADAGVKTATIKFVYTISHRLEAYDVAHEALSGFSDPYEVQLVADSWTIDCPVSFH